jgi:type III secretion protein J
MVKKILLLTSISFLVVGCNERKVTILQNVTQNDANEIILQLSMNSIDAAKVEQKDGGYSIQVDGDQEIKSLKVISSYGQPRNNYESMGTIFKKDGLISSPLEEHARYVDSLNQELAHTLSMIDGVITVRVQVSLPAPTDNLWSAESARPSASVLIKYRQGSRIDLLSNRIKLLVSRSVPGLAPDMVEVLPLLKKDS